MNKNIERGQSTREQLIAIATRLFGEHGYDATSIEAVLGESAVSRGALYHHFASKEALFEAVLAQVDADMADQTVAATRDISDPREALRVGCMAWVRLASDPTVQRIVLIDGPAVVGWERWREIVGFAASGDPTQPGSRHGFGLLRAAFRTISETGRLQPELVDLFAQMVLAALSELALVIARADDPDTATRNSEAAIDELLQRLLA